MALASLVSTLLCAVGLVYGANWAYEGSNGPVFWACDRTTQCGGRHQSPINIDTDRAEYKEELTEKFDFTNYQPLIGDLILLNDGHSAKVTLKAPVPIVGGGLDGAYNLSQFHFHWGSGLTHEGSEHVVNGKHYPMEVHFVHQSVKYGEYGDLSEAVNNTDGLAVLGIFFEIGEANVNYAPIIEGLKDIIHEGNTTALPPIALRTLLPSNTDSFYRYNGSLTTPACSEAVVWTVFKDTVKISRAQLDAFHILKSHDNKYIHHNYRPIQPLNRREVHTSISILPTGKANAMLPTPAPIALLLGFILLWAQ